MPAVERCVQGHHAFIYDRGGRRKVAEIENLSQVVWERARDDISEASVRIQNDSCDEQRDLINRLRSHRHEMVLFRGGDRVWEGPLHRVGSFARHADVVAKDVLSYVFATPLTRKWDNSVAGVNVQPMSTRLEAIINWEMTHDRTQIPIGGTVPVLVKAWENLDPPANVLPFLDVRHFPNEAKTAAVTLPYEMSVGAHITGSARTSGIDYTAVGRSIKIWDVSRSLGKIRRMTEADFIAPLAVTEYGADHAQSAYVVGMDGVYGSALNPENLDYYGPWTTIYTPYNEEGTNAPGVGELNSQAKRNLNGRSPAPVEVRVPDNSGVILSDTLTIDMLVPGVQVELLATLNSRQISQLQKIDHVRVTETGDGETVQITMTPATKADSDEEED